ncbi:MAG: hypothetical protein RJA25_1461, partial [Bacteroidota bacterium]
MPVLILLAYSEVCTVPLHIAHCPKEVKDIHNKKNIM